MKHILQRCAQSQSSSVFPAGRCRRRTLINPDTAFERVHTRTPKTHTPQLLLNSSQHLTPVLHLVLPDMAFSVTLDQVGSLLPANCSQTAELFYFLLLRIKLYGDCQGLFDSALRCSGSQHECFQHVLKCPIICCKQNRAT